MQPNPHQQHWQRTLGSVAARIAATPHYSASGRVTRATGMVLEATGWLQNPEEVMPADLRAKLDIRNFKDKPWNEKPSEVIPYDASVRKTWKYHAENVHDFAFTADPTYRIGEAEWNGVKCIAMAEEPHASGWQNAADYCAKVIRSRRPTLINAVIDEGGGTESGRITGLNPAAKKKP